MRRQSLVEIGWSNRGQRKDFLIGVWTHTLDRREEGGKIHPHPHPPLWKNLADRVVREKAPIGKSLKVRRISADRSRQPSRQI